MPTFVHLVTTLTLLALAPTAWAQTAPPLQTPTAAAVGQGLQWHARDAQDRAFDARRLRGKVAVVFVWSTACAVCRSALPELRANALGWRDKPFALLTLNADAQRADWLAYEQLVKDVAPAPPNVHTLWQGPSPTPVRLPVTLVLDAQGRVVARHEGRMAPQAWDAVAELLL